MAWQFSSAWNRPDGVQRETIAPPIMLGGWRQIATQFIFLVETIHCASEWSIQGSTAGFIVFVLQVAANLENVERTYSEPSTYLFQTCLEYCREWATVAHNTSN